MKKTKRAKEITLSLEQLLNRLRLFAALRLTVDEVIYYFETLVKKEKRK